MSKASINERESVQRLVARLGRINKSIVRAEGERKKSLAAEAERITAELHERKRLLDEALAPPASD